MAALLVAVGAAGCDGGAPAAEGSNPTTSSGGVTGMRVDMDAIFPPGEGRALVLNNCQSCHTWVPIVVLQMNEAEWERSSTEHRGRVQGLSDQEFETLYTYLKASFTPDTPVPDLPPALLESWTTY
jgi:mono/diheme cytochrome c family protein